ncbi:MAG: transposase [Elusimicrobiota bacterium]|nr:transposase [Elusimicrobiota bacterium]
MSLPELDLQRTFFDTDILFPRLGSAAGAERFSFFAERILPELMKRRPELEKMYCANNGRPAEEPVRMLAATILQFMERMPDRQAAEACSFDLRWKLALGMEADEPAFHATSLVKFRERLLSHGLEQLGFAAVLERMGEAGYLAKRNRQRLDSTHIIGLVSRMSRLDCIRETFRLALEELSRIESLPRPGAWALWWERYVESRIDYRSSGDIIRAKMGQAGIDARDALAWIKELPMNVRQGEAAKLLQRVFNENFETGANGAVEKVKVRPTGAVQNPHNPEAQWSSKETLTEKTWVGHKVQVAETVEDMPCQTGEPTKNVITAIVTQNAIESDKAGMAAVFAEQKRLGMEKPEILYADAAYVSGPSMAQAQSESRELMGPAIASPDRGVYTCEAFHVDVERRYAICPSGKTSTQCARMKAGKTGRITYRFEWCGLCQSCAVKGDCLHKGERDRMLRVNEHHTLTQARRKLMRTEEFKKDMRHRNGIEGTQSELVRGYGLRRARYRGNKKTRLQNYFIGAACNIKRWCRRVTWEAQQVADRGVRMKQPLAVSA